MSISCIYIDESGDLGFDFTKSTSNYFLITSLFTANNRPVEKVVKKTFLSLPNSVRKKHSGCLHSTKEKAKTRMKLLSLLNQKDIAIVAIYLNKRKVYTRLQEEKHVLYNYVANILLDRIYTKRLVPVTNPINVIVSQRETNKFLNLNFTNYLQNQIQENHKLKINVQIKPPHADKCLQAVDFACWALFRKIERRDESYANLIRSKVVEESPLFP